MELSLLNMLNYSVGEEAMQISGDNSNRRKGVPE